MSDDVKKEICLVFCKMAYCSDGDDKQYPECSLADSCWKMIRAENILTLIDANYYRKDREVKLNCERRTKCGIDESGCCVDYHFVCNGDQCFNGYITKTLEEIVE